MNLKYLMKVKDNGNYKSLKLKKIKDEKTTVSTGIFGVAFKDVSEEDIKSVLEEHKGEKGNIQGIQYVIGDMEIDGDEAYIEMKMATDKDEEFVSALLKEWGLADYIEDTVTDFETSEEEVENNEEGNDGEESADGESGETDWDELEDVAKEKNKEIGANYHFNGKEKFQYGDHVVIKTKDGDVKGIVFNTDVYGDHKEFDILYKSQNGEVKLQQYVEEEYLEKVSDSRRIKDDKYSDELIGLFEEYLNDYTTSDEFYAQDITKDYSGAYKEMWFSQSEPASYFISSGYSTGSNKVDNDIEKYWNQYLDRAASEKGTFYDDVYDTDDDYLKDEIWELADSIFDDTYVYLNVYATSKNNQLIIEVSVASDVAGEMDESYIYNNVGSSMEEVKRMAKDVAELSIRMS